MVDEFERAAETSDVHFGPPTMLEGEWNLLQAMRALRA